MPNVWRFKGRDTRAEFWPYAGAAFALYLIAGMAFFVPMLLSATVEQQSPGDPIERFAGQFLTVSLLSFLGLLALLAAAVARRLRDSGWSALWGLLPLPFVAYSVTGFPRLLSQVFSTTPDTGLFLSIFASNLLYLLSSGFLLVLLVRPSASGPNRYWKEG